MFRVGEFLRDYSGTTLAAQSDWSVSVRLLKRSDRLEELQTSVRGIAQPGRALALGARGREFESRCPDHYYQSLRKCCYPQRARKLDAIRRGKELKDTRRWLSTFFTDIDPYLLDISRHGTRLCNSLQVTWSSVEGEVDWTDLVALETLRLHELNLHAIILEKLDLLTEEYTFGLGSRVASWDSRGVALDSNPCPCRTNGFGGEGRPIFYSPKLILLGRAVGDFRGRACNTVFSGLRRAEIASTSQRAGVRVTSIGI